ncbi:MAG: class I tRNA ligase family protein, partial [Spirochaetia bacterium]|nr:class I tRNA ligase family protein [Spirochaetia bacterium]
HGVDLYVGGAEHAVLHLLYARFWHKVLYDYGIVSTIEPFKKLVHQGIILGEDGSKMSKSRGNVVNPDDVVAEFGADAFRLFEMFLGPLEQSKPWSSNGLEGVSRFLSRAWRLFTLDTGTDDAPAGGAAGKATGQAAAPLESAKLDPRVIQEPSAEAAKEIEKLIHKTIRKVTEDVEKMSFNTSISQLMIFVNETLAKKQIGRFGAESFALLLSPFAPHMAEELWRLLGHNESIATAAWPAFDPEKTKDDDIEIVFQVNGKLRGKARMSVSAGEEDVKARALKDPGVEKAMDGKEPKRIIVVKNKLVNIVV